WRDGQGRVIQRALVAAGPRISLWNTHDVIRRDALGRIQQTDYASGPQGSQLMGSEAFATDSAGRVHNERFAFAFAQANVLDVASSYAAGGNRPRLPRQPAIGDGAAAAAAVWPRRDRPADADRLGPRAGVVAGPGPTRALMDGSGVAGATAIGDEAAIVRFGLLHDGLVHARIRVPVGSQGSDVMSGVRNKKQRNCVVIGGLVLIKRVVWTQVWDVVAHGWHHMLVDQAREDLLCGEAASAWKLIDRRDVLSSMCVIDGVMNAVNVGALPNSRVSASDARRLLHSAIACGGSPAAHFYAHRHKSAAADAKSWLPSP
ncbi:MAG: hypothetical protein ACK6D2_17265, partial [Planctomycetota bacterium]